MGTRINLAYQVDNTQFDSKMVDNIKQPGGGNSSLEVVNANGDEMSGELKCPKFTLNTVYSGDECAILGSYSGADSTLHIRFGNTSTDKLRIEYWNGSTADSVMEVTGGKNFTYSAVNYSISAIGNTTISGDNSLTLSTGSIAINQGNNKIRVLSSKWQFTNDNTNWYDLHAYVAGNASGNMPISNGTLCTDLNSDKFDGYHAGTGSGQVPVSTGTKCTNLNADLWDGGHKTISTGGPSGGSDGDVWYHV